MPNNKQKTFILFIPMILLAANLACNMPLRGQPTTEYSEPIPVTTEAAERLDEDIDIAVTAVQSNKPFTLIIDETQLTSFVTLKLQSIQEPQITDIQVYLRDGQVRVSGAIDQDGISLPLNIVFTISVNSIERPQINIITAEVGPFPLPQSTIDQFSSQLDENLLGQFYPDINGIIIEDITIVDGIMTISGHPR